MTLPRIGWMLVLTLLVAATGRRTLAHSTLEQQKPAANQSGAATKAFLDRLQDYVRYHNNVEKMVPPLTRTSDPARISDREKALGDALIKQRPDAKPGDFLITQYQPILAQIIKDDFAQRPVADRKALIRELPKGLTINVNTIYPPTIALATFPPNLLQKLPALPRELEYRIVGRDLILRDVTGNVVVDVMREVFPIPA
jgi:methionine-rich copper-binding protein CopC